MGEVVWHRCVECGGRLSPFTKFDAQTEAPEPGKSGNAILLKTYNANAANLENRIAWCPTDKKMVTVTRIGEAEIWQMYLGRRGVVVREHRLRELYKVRVPKRKKPNPRISVGA